MRCSAVCIAAVVAALLLAGCGDVRQPFETETGAFAPSYSIAGTGERGMAVDLIAGRTEDIGEVRCWIAGDSLFIRYTADGPWALAETHASVTASVGEMPLTKSGNPKVGRFMLKGEHDPPAATVRYALDLASAGLEGVPTLVVAAHAAAVELDGGGAVVREEGAWGAGTPLAGYEEPVEADRIERPIETKGAIDAPGLEGAPLGKGNWAMFFTVDVAAVTVTGLTINEVFYAGSDASQFYFFDQFVELHNSSADTLFLDGLVLTRLLQTSYPDIEDVDFVRGVYAFQFPGTPVTGRQHPIAPGEYVVIAADAIDHSAYSAHGVDLSGADWECFNPLGSDYDNPDVPNIVSIHPTKTTDFMINLAHNAIVVATGASYEFVEYAGDQIYVHVPIATIVDGVEYNSTADGEKTLTVRVDAGFAGIGLAKYSARSIERIAPGWDTGNSTIDFLNTTAPTPGWSSAE